MARTGTPAPLWTPERLFTLFPNLGEMPDRLAGVSGSEQQMLTVARTLTWASRCWCCWTSPSEGVAPVIDAANGAPSAR